MIFDIATVIAVAATFMLAGIVKGVIGLGLPTVSLALLTLVVGLPQAMALLLAPSFVTNFWQAVVGGNGITIVRRLWLFLLPAAAAVWLGSQALPRIDLAWLSMLLGLLLIIYGGINLAGWKLTIAARHQVWVGPLAGLVNGILTGMTGSFVVPGVMYLQALGLTRDTLIQAMGVLFTVSTLALALALARNGMLSVELGSGSALAVLPAVVGMWLGQRLRQRLSEQRFRQLFFIALLVLGGYIVFAATTLF